MKLSISQINGQKAAENNEWVKLMDNFSCTDCIKKFHDYYVKNYGRIQYCLKRLIIYKSEQFLLEINISTSNAKKQQKIDLSLNQLKDIRNIIYLLGVYTPSDRATH